MSTPITDSSCCATGFTANPSGDEPVSDHPARIQAIEPVQSLFRQVDNLIDTTVNASPCMTKPQLARILSEYLIGSTPPEPPGGKVQAGASPAYALNEAEMPDIDKLSTGKENATAPDTSEKQDNLNQPTSEANAMPGDPVIVGNNPTKTDQWDWNYWQTKYYDKWLGGHSKKRIPIVIDDHGKCTGGQCLLTPIISTINDFLSKDNKAFQATKSIATVQLGLQEKETVSKCANFEEIEFRYQLTMVALTPLIKACIEEGIFPETLINKITNEIRNSRLFKRQPLTGLLL